MLQKISFITPIFKDCSCKEEAFEEFKKSDEYKSSSEYFILYNFISTLYEIYEILPK